MQVEANELISILQAAYPFHLLEAEEIEDVFKHAAVYQYEIGQEIYAQTQPSNRIYLLAAGKVKLFKTDRRSRVIFTESVQLGNLFGLECADNQKRWSFAVAETPVVVLSVNLKHLQTILHKYPILAEPLESNFNAHKISFQRHFSWKETDETFYFADHRHPAVLLWKLVTPILVWITGMLALLLFLSSTSPANPAAWYLAAGLLLAVFVWVILLWIDWDNDFAIVTNRRVLFQEKIILLYDSRQEAPINAVLSVGRDTTQIGRIFQFGELVVQTYTGVILLPAIRNPELVTEVIAYSQQQKMTSIGRSERVEQMAVSLRNQLAGEKADLKENIQKTQQTNRGFGDVLSSFIMLRVEHDGTITYRTHWLILFQRILAPTLVLVFLQLVLIARLTSVISVFEPVGVALVIGMLDLAALLWWVYQFLDWRNDYYVITYDQVEDVYKKPLGTEDKRVAPLKNIQSINFKRNGLLGILFNYGTVYILIGDNQLTFNNVFNPSEVQREIFNRLYTREYKQKLDEEKAEQLRIREWIEAYNRVLLDIESEQSLKLSLEMNESHNAQDNNLNPENQGTIADENEREDMF